MTDDDPEPAPAPEPPAPPAPPAPQAEGDARDQAATASALDEVVLYQSPLLYRLLRTAAGQLELEAVVGGFALTTVRLPLDEDELRAYQLEGAPFLDRLARALMADPPFSGRSRLG